MNIELKLTRDFERFLDELKKKYGEDFEYINGIVISTIVSMLFVSFPWESENGIMRITMRTLI